MKTHRQTRNTKTWFRIITEYSNYALRSDWIVAKHRNYCNYYKRCANVTTFALRTNKCTQTLHHADEIHAWWDIIRKLLSAFEAFHFPRFFFSVCLSTLKVNTTTIIIKFCWMFSLCSLFLHLVIICLKVVTVGFGRVLIHTYI